MQQPRNNKKLSFSTRTRVFLTLKAGTSTTGSLDPTPGFPGPFRSYTQKKSSKEEPSAVLGNS